MIAVPQPWPFFPAPPPPYGMDGGRRVQVGNVAALYVDVNDNDVKAAVENCTALPVRMRGQVPMVLHSKASIPQT